MVRTVRRPGTEQPIEARVTSTIRLGENRVTGTKRMTRRGSLSLCLLVASACWIGVSPAYAQTAAGEITGVVHDQDGAAVPGATITVTETRTNLQRVVVSTRDGVYTAASLAPGEYRLDVELAGFKPIRREGIRLATGEKARIDFDLSVGDIREQVRSWPQTRRSCERRPRASGPSLRTSR